MTEYLNIDRNEQAKLIRKMKLDSGFTWRKIWEELGVTRAMVYFYRSGKCRIPKDKLEKLAKLSGCKLDFSILLFEKGNYSLQIPEISEMNEDFAEFLGILFGDGCLASDNYIIQVSGDSISDLLYHKNRVAPLFYNLFKLETRFKFEKEKQEMHTILSSKIVHEYIAKTFSFPIGEKKGRMHIPSKIYEKDEYKRAFLRGLFDTDGGIHRHHAKSAQVHYTSSDPVFLKEVFHLYDSLGFNVRTTDEDLEFFSRNEINRYFIELKPKNPKHLYKYRKFIENGIVPRHRDINYKLLNAGAGD